MLAAKLALTPSFLLLVALAGRYYGPSVAGWLAGLPLVTGPILFFLALEHGPAFATSAAGAATAAVFGSLSFCLAYAHSAQRHRWTIALPLALCTWLAAVVLLSFAPASAMISTVIAAATLLLAPRLFPIPQPSAAAWHVSTAEQAARIGAALLLTLAVTWLAENVGSTWSGLLAVFPVLSTILAVFTHRANGAKFTATLLRAMAIGMYSFAAFCAVLAVALPLMPLAQAFTSAFVLCMLVQLVTRKYLLSPA